MFHDEAFGEALGIVKSLCQLLAVGCFAYTHARTQVGRLHNHRIAQFFLHLLYQSVAVGTPLHVCEPNIVYNRHTRGTQNHLHGDFVHAVGAGEYIAACKGQAYGLQHTLKDAVFAVGAVQYGQSHVKTRNHGSLLAPHIPFGAIQVVIAEFRAHIDFCGLFHQFAHVAIIAHIEQHIARIPAPLFGYVNRNYIIFVGVEGMNGLKGRNHRYFMLYTATAEKNCYIGLHLLY